MKRQRVSTNHHNRKAIRLLGPTAQHSEEVRYTGNRWLSLTAAEHIVVLVKDDTHPQLLLEPKLQQLIHLINRYACQRRRTDVVCLEAFTNNVGECREQPRSAPVIYALNVEPTNQGSAVRF